MRKIIMSSLQIHFTSYSHLCSSMTGKQQDRQPAILPEDEVKEVVDAWVDILKIPMVVGGYIQEDENFLNVVSDWMLDDAAKKERLLYSQTFSVLKSLLDQENPLISSGPPVIHQNLTVASSSGQKRAILSNQSGVEYLQIWNENVLQKTYNLTELNIHKQVYTSGGWGITMIWSRSESKLAYLAEQKAPPAKSFYTSAAASPKDENKKGVPEKFEVGEEYIYKQSWGELLQGHYQSVIVVLDVNTDEFKVLPLPERNFPTDLQWIGDSHVCGTTYPIPVWRLGLLGASNRESRIFVVGANGDNFQYLTPEKRACRNARVRPDGGYVIWHERILDGAHNRARSIYGLTLNDGVPSGQPRLIRDASPTDGLPEYNEFGDVCWSPSGATFYFVTPNDGVSVCLAITIGESSVDVKRIDYVDLIIGITNEYLVVVSSSAISSPVLRLLKISQNFKAIEIIQPSRPLDPQNIITEHVYGEMSPPSIYHGPACDSVPPKSVPLIAYPHGGPHFCFLDQFSPDVVFFLKSGFAVIHLNFVGSTGGTRDTADDLMGRVGDRDVKDCQTVVEKVLATMTCLDPEKVFVFGGSHGGFLTCHLSSAYPSTYKAAVAASALTDVMTFVGTTDITEWAYAESGVNFPEDPIKTLIPTARDLVDAEKYIKASPIHNVENVTCPTLILSGSLDARVPAHQGINYYRALLAYGKEAELRVYPDTHSLSTVPVRLDSFIQTVLWFKKYLPQSK